MFKYAALAVVGVAIASIGPSLGQTKANYSVTLEASWTAEMHPLEYPSNAHFSGLVGATHNGGYVMFKDGGVASEGLRRLAERGSHSPDWFTGATISLMKDGTWVEGKTVTLYAWDAGTDSGKTYGAADEETSPRQPIMMNAAPHFTRDGKPTPVAKLTFKKMN